MNIEQIFNRKEIFNIMEKVSTLVDGALWLATDNVEIIERVGEIWGTEKQKGIIEKITTTRIYSDECLPHRIKARKEAVEKKSVVLYKNPFEFFAFTSPISNEEGMVIGFLEGDFIKAKELDEVYTDSLKEIASNNGLPPDMLLNLLKEEKLQDEKTITTTIEIVSETLKLYTSTSSASKDFYSKLYNIGNGIRRIAKNIQVLGINAAIEAARLGEEGTGFAVVAGEIKKVGDYVFSQVDELEKLIATYKKSS